MYQFKISYRHRSGLRYLGIYWGSRGSVLEDVLRDHEDLALCDIVVEKLS